VPFTAALSGTQHTLSKFLNIACTEFYRKSGPNIKNSQEISFVLVCSNVTFMAQIGTSFTAADLHGTDWYIIHNC
jgi:hypothetical protein